MHALPRGHLLAGADPGAGSCHGAGTAEDLDTLLDTCDNILGRAFCALGDGATSRIASSLKYFRDEYVARYTPVEQSRLGCALRLEPVGAPLT